MTHCRHARDRRPAIAAVELVVVLILLVPLLLGVWEVGRLVQVQQMLANAAREGGRQASTGNKTAAQVRQDVKTYMAAHGVTVQDGEITVTNKTSGARPDPTQAEQLDHFEVTVTIPFDRVRWILLNQITPVTTLSGAAHWYSTRDIPITVDATIPTS